MACVADKDVAVQIGKKGTLIKGRKNVQMR